MKKQLLSLIAAGALLSSVAAQAVTKISAGDLASRITTIINNECTTGVCRSGVPIRTCDFLRSSWRDAKVNCQISNANPWLTVTQGAEIEKRLAGKNFFDFLTFAVVGPLGGSLTECQVIQTYFSDLIDGSFRNVCPQFFQ